MRIVITGATGLIGRHAVTFFSQQGYEVLGLVRKVSVLPDDHGAGHVSYFNWPEPADPIWSFWFSEPCIVLNLAGENIAGRRWTKKRRQQLTDSRIMTTDRLVKAIQLASHKPVALLQASAIGYYGDRKGEMLNENSTKGSGFLSSLVEEWESTAKKAEAFGVRLCLIRSGVVLAKEGGAIPKLAMPVRYFAGAWPGNGKQFVSWIHIQDLLQGLKFLAESSEINGTVNLCAPEAVRMKDFVKAIGKVYKRPVFMSIPSLLLKLALGDMATETLLPEQRVSPLRLMQNDFKFKFPEIFEALRDLK